MSTSRYRIYLWAGIALAVVWTLVFSGYRVMEAMRPTPEKLTAYASSLDLAALSAEDRRAALEKLARQLNALSYEDRREVRLGRSLEPLFREMTEAERGWFVERTLPTGVRQMLDAFEAMPEETRQRAVEQSLKRLREAQTRLQSSQGAPPPDRQLLSEEMQRKMVEMGMKTFYTESSAQTKAELAPVLEEMQRLMESGRLMRGRWR